MYKIQTMPGRELCIAEFRTFHTAMAWLASKVSEYNADAVEWQEGCFVDADPVKVILHVKIGATVYRLVKEKA